MFNANAIHVMSFAAAIVRPLKVKSPKPLKDTN